jgi:hypothetical protein
LVESL